MWLEHGVRLLWEQRPHRKDGAGGSREAGAALRGHCRAHVVALPVRTIAAVEAAAVQGEAAWACMCLGSRRGSRADGRHVHSCTALHQLGSQGGAAAEVDVHKGCQHIPPVVPLQSTELDVRSVVVSPALTGAVTHVCPPTTRNTQHRVADML